MSFITRRRGLNQEHWLELTSNERDYMSVKQAIKLFAVSGKLDRTGTLRRMRERDRKVSRKWDD